MIELVEQLENRLGRLIEEIENLRDARMTLLDENQRLQSTASEAESLAVQLRDREAEIARFAEERQQIDSLQAQVANLTKLQEDYDYAQLRIEELETWHNNVCTNRDEIQTQLDSANAANQQLLLELETARNAAQVSQNELCNQQQRVSELESQLFQSNAEKDRLFAESQQFQNDLFNTRQSLSNVEYVRDALFGERDTLNAQVASLQAQLAQAAEVESQMKVRLSQLSERIQLAENSFFGTSMESTVTSEAFRS
ncbi:MAG: hypothetical protein SFY68_09370 [Candidatus Sumerlaeia bacterium]|nr:hypothetical protein [Candidatus Sumerlaeia bacterium]